VSETRAGAFIHEADGTLQDGRGRVVLGLRNALHVPSGGVVDAHALGLPSTSRIRSGFLEGPAVDAIAEMIDVLSAERSFESAEKAVAAIDATRQKSADAARVK
jgi:flagellar basal body rod protein FlgG